MTKCNKNNKPISSTWKLRCEITLGTVLQMILLLGMIGTGWSNLRSALAIIQHDLDRLLQTERKLEAQVDSLSENVFNHEYRLGHLETQR